jgi:dienelactone hydrolase
MKTIHLNAQVGRLLLTLSLLSGCAADSTTPSGTDPSTNPLLVGFHLSGDPESSSGATWTYKATTGGIAYDLRGILLKPRGQGPFPAVILSHGGHQNALTMLPAAMEMVSWGLVCIATNYTHATDTGAPIGSPGTEGERGATQSNILRARKVLDILLNLGYVDKNRVAAHGFSNGGFVTTAVLATYPSSFRVASHAAAGVQDPTTGSPPSAPSPTLASAVRTPYNLHHGDPDETNPLSSDQRLASLLSTNGVPHELWIYPGGGHVGFVQNPIFYARIRAWYEKFGLL